MKKTKIPIRLDIQDHYGRIRHNSKRVDELEGSSSELHKAHQTLRYG